MERIAKALYEEEHGISRWESVPESERHRQRRIVEGVLHRGVIKVGARPQLDAPMTGQTVMGQAPDG